MPLSIDIICLFIINLIFVKYVKPSFRSVIKAGRETANQYFVTILMIFLYFFLYLDGQVLGYSNSPTPSPKCGQIFTTPTLLEVPLVMSMDLIKYHFEKA